MTEPTATTISFDAGGWNQGYEYRKDTSQSTSSSVFYELYAINGGAANTRHGLEFRRESDGTTTVYANTSNNSYKPFLLRKNEGSAGASVSLDGFNGTTDKLQGLSSSNINTASLQFRFLVTNAHLWTAASGSGASTLSVSVNSIYLDVNGAPWVRGTIASSEPTGSYPVTAGGVLVQGSLVTNPISHTNGTETVFSFPIAYGGAGIWHLHQNYVSSALNTPIATVIVPSSTQRKKVFCNFW